MRDKEKKFTDLDTQWNEIIEELRIVEYTDFEDMVFSIELTFSKIESILDMKHIHTSTKRYTFVLGIYEIIDNISKLNSLLPNKVKVNITIVDIRLKSNLTTNKTMRFTEKSFFYTILASTQSHSGPLSDIEGFFQLILGKYKINRPNFITGVNQVHLKWDSVNGSIVNAIREPFLYSFGPFSPLGQKFFTKP